MSAPPSRPRIEFRADAQHEARPRPVRAAPRSVPQSRPAPARHTLLILSLLLASRLASAQPAADPLFDWSLCHTQYAPPPHFLAMPQPEQPGVTLLSAEHAHIVDRTLLSMHGDVEAIRDGQMLRADRATYDKDRDLLRTEGNVSYLRKEIAFDGERGEMQLETDQGYLENARFLLYERHARGHAERAVIEDRDRTLLSRMSYTTCDPGKDDWLLKASRVRLDQSTGAGTARNVTVSFKGVPFLYTPYLSFPIDDRRKSGFLSPTLRDSSKNGIDFAMPYYLNLAPRFDATLTPRIVTERGGMLESEFRYLNRKSRGQIDAAWLPNDDLAARDRYLLHYRHAARPSERLSLDIDFNRASDGEYFRDLGNNLSIASITHLEQRALLSYQANDWMASARLQAYQTIDDTIRADRRPYRQLPVLLFRTQRPEYSSQLNARFVTSYVNFDHDDRVPTGGRLELQPSVTLPFYSMAAYAQPSLTLRHTAYHLNETGPSIDESGPRRTLPVFSFDTGLFLERDTRWGDRPMLQTLEPRLYYLYIPYRDQSDLPLFDSGRPDFNFTQLFRDNRFNGSDRVGDANQLSLAVTSRLLDGVTARQRAQFGIGRIVYFRDREVTLNGIPETAQVSDIVAEGTANLTRSITLRFDARRSEETGKFDKGGVWLQYRPAPRSIFNISYRYRSESLEQTDVSLLWPLSPRWHLIARRNYSLLDARILETLAGLEYQSCCWRLRVVSRRFVDDDLGNTDRSIFVQFDLKGLTSIGSSLESLLEHGILGYRY